MIGVTFSYSLFKTELNVRKPFNYYLDSLINNSQNYNKLIPGSKMVLYCDNSVPENIIITLKKNNVIIKTQPKSNGWEGTLWRFKELKYSNENNIIILQDADSDILVENGILNKMVTLLNDSQYSAILHHGIVSINKVKEKNKWIMAGQSIFKKKLDLDIDNLIKYHISELNRYDSDEIFLSKYVWDLIKEDCLINIERRALPILMSLDDNNNIPKWVKEKKIDGRIISNLTEK